MQTARIYQRPKNAMQSGKARTDHWQLEFEPGEPKRPDPLTGWAGSGDTRDQIRLSFPTCEAAVAYAREHPEHGIIAAEVHVAVVHPDHNDGVRILRRIHRRAGGQDETGLHRPGRCL